MADEISFPAFSSSRSPCRTTGGQDAARRWRWSAAQRSSARCFGRQADTFCDEARTFAGQTSLPGHRQGRFATGQACRTVRAVGRTVIAVRPVTKQRLNLKKRAARYRGLWIADRWTGSKIGIALSCAGHCHEPPVRSQAGSAARVEWASRPYLLRVEQAGRPFNDD